MQGVLRTIRSRPFVVTLLALGFYVAFASVVTYPFILHPTSTIIAPMGGDVSSSIAKYEALHEGRADPFRTAHLPSISVPDGPESNVGVDRVSFFSVLYLWQASNVIGAIAAHSLMSFMGYILTAFVMFLFVWRITKSQLAGLIAGFAYGFWPTMYSLAGSDMTYMHMWLYILPIWAFWSLANKDLSWKSYLIAGASIVPAMFWTPYYAFHVLLVGGVSLIVASYYLLKKYTWQEVAIRFGLVGISWILLLGVYRYVGLHAPSAEIPVRSISDLYQLAAHPLMYILPGKFSWGAHGDSLLVHLVARANWTNLYLGISVLTLALTALVYGYLTRRNEATVLLRGIRSAIVLCSVIVLACLLFSLPPRYHIWGLTVIMPSEILVHTVPALRAGQRFVMPLMAAIATLSGIGAWVLLRKVMGPKRYIFAALTILVIGFDLWALPPGSITHIQTYGSLVSLSAMPSGITAQFHDGSLLNAPPHLPCLLQHEHGMPLVNDCALGRSRDLGRILELPLCEQITALRSIGTKYLIIENSDNKIATCLISQNTIKSIVGVDDVYKVVLLSDLAPEEFGNYTPSPKLP